MRRSGPPERRTELKRTGPLPRSGRAGKRSRTPAARRRARENAIYYQGRRDCWSRANGRCEARTGDHCEIRGAQCHHILPRSAGGANDASNLMLVCAPCHDYIHSHPEESYGRRWLRRRS